MRLHIALALVLLAGAPVTAETFTILGFKFCVSEVGRGDPCDGGAVSSPAMGLEIAVPEKPGQEVVLDDVVGRLANAGVTAMVVMVDGQLVAPGKPLAPKWKDARIRTPAGTVTLSRRAGEVAVVVFGNADEALRKMQEQVAAAL